MVVLLMNVILLIVKDAKVTVIVMISVLVIYYAFKEVTQRP